MFRFHYSAYITFTMTQRNSQQQEIKGEGWEDGVREGERQGGKQACKQEATDS